MKKIFCCFCIVCFFAGTMAGQSFAWAKRAGSYAFDLGYGIGTDNAGNVYIAGKYEQNAVFGSTKVTCAGNHDIYLAKYDPNGNLLWVRTAGGTGGDYAHCLAVDAAGNSYVSGEFEKTTAFGTASLTTSGSNDVFLAKYDTNGNLVWVKKALGGPGSDRGLGVCVKGSNVFLTGSFGLAGNSNGTALTSAGLHDVFIIKYNTDGVFQWARRAGGINDDDGNAIAADALGNCYVTGFFTGSATFGSTTITSYGSKDIFIAKYNSSGSVVWVKKAGGTAVDIGNGIQVDKDNRVFVTGGYRVKSTFGTYTMTAQKGDADIFVARYDANGNAEWVRKASGLINDYGRAIALDAASNVYITGNYGLNCAFGTYTLTGTDSTEIYFASYDANGTFRWALKAGGEYDASDPGRFIEMGLSIATDPSGNVFGSGAYRSNSTFGGITLAPYNNHTDVYLTKIVQGTPKISEPLVSLTTEETNEITIYPNPNNGAFKINIDPTISQQTNLEIRIAVLNTRGEVVYYETLDTSQQLLNHSIDLGNSIKPGMYYVHVMVGNESKKTKVVMVSN